MVTCFQASWNGISSFTVSCVDFTVMRRVTTCACRTSPARRRKQFRNGQVSDARTRFHIAFQRGLCTACIQCERGVGSHEVAVAELV